LPLEIDTRDLLGSRREATLIHAGERYRLRVTSNNKLILTK
jgi:hemin uptake protein HemP